MTKTVVVPLDGSELAERAVLTGAWLAQDLHAELHLVTATSGDVPEQQRYLAAQAEASGRDGVELHVVEHRFAAVAVTETVASLPDPILCMSTRGRGGWAEALLGSVSDEILRSAPVPVVLVGPRSRAAEPPSRSVVVSVDGSDGSFAVLPTVAEWRHGLGLDVHVVTVAQCGHTGRLDPREQAARFLVDEAVAALRRMDTPATPHVLNSAYPADVVVAFAAGLPAALIASGTHGRSGFSTKALGTVVTDIVRHAHAPVLVRRIAG